MFYFVFTIIHTCNFFKFIYLLERRERAWGGAERERERERERIPSRLCADRALTDLTN